MITYLKGDATEPIGDGKKLIIHCCNDIGKWGRGFVLALSKKWKEPQGMYLKWYNSIGGLLRLGEVQIVPVDEDLFVCNMIGQHGIYPENDVPPIRLNSVEDCLNKVNGFCEVYDFTIHAPRFGAGLAGGKWEDIEKLINKCITSADVYIYDLEDK